MEKKNTLANFVPASAAMPPQAQADSQRQNVAYATNAPSSSEWLAVALLALLGLVGIIGFALQRLTGWPLALVAVLSCIIYAIAGFVVLLVVNGDWLAWREIANNARNQRLAIFRHANLLDASEDNRHTEAVLRLQIDLYQAQANSQFQQIAVQLDALNRRLLTDGGGQTVVNNLSTYVEATPNPIRQMALDWVATLYKDNRPDPDKVLPSDGRIRVRTPWSARGEWDTATSAAALQFLTDNKVIRIGDNGTHLACPSLAELGRI